MAEPEDVQSKMLAAIDRLTLAVEQQGAQVESLLTTQISPPRPYWRLCKSALSPSRRLVQSIRWTPQRSSRLQERLEARLAQAPSQPDAQRSDSPPRQVHLREGATDEGMGVATTTSTVW